MKVDKSISLVIHHVEENLVTSGIFSIGKRVQNVLWNRSRLSDFVGFLQERHKVVVSQEIIFTFGS